MNIYFAGSISGHPHGKEVYGTIIEELRKHGTVLTEIYQRSHKTPNPTQYSSQEEIFQQDIKMLDNSDLIVAEVTWPSHGCGREICYGQYVCQVPIICFSLEGMKVSSMLKGNPYLKIYTYTENTLKEIIENALTQNNF